MKVIKSVHSLSESVVLNLETKNETLSATNESDLLDKEAIKTLFKDEIASIFETTKNEGLASGLKEADALIESKVNDHKNILDNKFQK